MVQDTGSPLWSQVGRQLSVARVVGFHPVLSVFVAELPGTCAGSRPFLCPVRSTTRSHGAPHSGQQPRALVDAKIIGSTNVSGQTA